MKNKLFALLVLVCLLSGCTAKNSNLAASGETNTIVSTAVSTNTEKTVLQEENRLVEEKDVSGPYSGCNGTDVHSQLNLILMQNGAYAVEMDLYNEEQVLGKAFWKDGFLYFSDEENGIIAYIFVIDDSAQVIMIRDEYDMLDEIAYSFTYGTSEDVSDTQAQEDMSEKSLFEVIAAQIILDEIGAEELQQKLADAMTQYDINMASYDLYLYWDDVLNTIWGMFEDKLNTEDMELLKRDQLEWIAYKEEESEAAGKEYEGGSMYSYIVNSKATKLTKNRIYELAKYAMDQ